MVKNEKLNFKKSFKAMFIFLDKIYKKSKSGDLACLLSDIEVDKNGRPLDAAAPEDWL